jgi:site-specific recombinase XerD
MSTQVATNGGMQELAAALVDELIARMTKDNRGSYNRVVKTKLPAEAHGPAHFLPAGQESGHVNGSNVVELPRPARRKRTLPKTLSQTEVDALLSAIDTKRSGVVRVRDRCMLELMYRAGLRVGEVVKLEPRDVAIGENVGTVRIVDGKGGDGTAYFDPGSLEPLLTKWLRVREALGLDHSRWLFCTIRGGRYSPTKGKIRSKPGQQVNVRTVQLAIKRYAKRAGIEGWDVPRRVTPHVLRHTFATELLDEGLHLREVQAALRHAHLQTTATYLHVHDPALAQKIGARSRGLTLV